MSKYPTENETGAARRELRGNHCYTLRGPAFEKFLNAVGLDNRSIRRGWKKQNGLLRDPGGNQDSLGHWWKCRIRQSQFDQLPHDLIWRFGDHQNLCHSALQVKISCGKRPPHRITRKNQCSIGIRKAVLSHNEPARSKEEQRGYGDAREE